MRKSVVIAGILILVGIFLFELYRFMEEKISDKTVQTCIAKANGFSEVGIEKSFFNQTLQISHIRVEDIHEKAEGEFFVDVEVEVRMTNRADQKVKTAKKKARYLFIQTSDSWSCQLSMEH